VSDPLKDILEELRKLSGDTDGDGISDSPTSSVYDIPPPPIIFPTKLFCFTGTFNYGERCECEEAVEERGGKCGGIAQKTDYLVIGAKITDAWKHATFGNKISQARAWQAEGKPINIVSEAHWKKHLDETDPNKAADAKGPSGPNP
jgi:NAD-dependent DNA ligase